MCSGTVTTRMIIVSVVHDLRLAMVRGKHRWGDLSCIEDSSVPSISVGLVASNSLGSVSVTVHSWVHFVHHIAVMRTGCVLCSSGAWCSVRA